MRYLQILFISFLISLGSTSSSIAETNSWAKLALQDLAAIKSELEESHPGAVDSENPQFAKWLEEGYVEASNLAKKADSFGGYYFALLRYTDGFNDKHLDIFLDDEVENYDNLWPNFALSLQDEQFIVSDLSNIGFEVAKQDLPQPGDVLTACDGKSASELFTSNILPFYGIDGLAASERANAPRLMFDEGNPYIQHPQKCTFENESGQYDLNLDWRSISSEEKDSIINYVVRGNSPEIGFREIEPGVFWITLSTFAPSNGLLISQLRGVIKAASEQRDELRSSDVIVFDVRGNGGGSSSWGVDLLNSIWGEGFVERLPGAGAEAVDYRVSAGNIARYQQIRKWAADGLLGDSIDVSDLDNLIAGMEEALNRGETYYNQSVGLVSPEKAIRPGEVTPKIYLLSNGVCKSACLDFADLVLSIPNAELIGTQTSADTNYIENRPVKLPSNKAYLWLSMKVYRGRVRGSNEPYLPIHRWNSNFWDTKELQDWVLRLSAN